MTISFRFTAMILFTVVCASFAAGHCAPRSTVIKDRHLETAIRRELGKFGGELTSDDLTRVTSITAMAAGIEVIDGLESCINLRELNLTYNKIEDISPLTNLTGLQVLILSDNQISELLPLDNLDQLRHLNLRRNNICDISALSSLLDLEELLISGNEINDIEPLSSLSSLKTLELNKNQITRIEALSSLSEMVTLDIGFNNVTDLGPLVDNPGLGDGDYLALYMNPLSEEAISIQIPQLLARGVQLDPRSDIAYAQGRN